MAGMNFDAIRWARDLPLGAGRSADKAIILTIAAMIDEDGICWPSQQKLADQVSMTRNALNRSLKRLRAEHIVAMGDGQAAGLPPRRTNYLGLALFLKPHLYAKHSPAALRDDWFKKNHPDLWSELVRPRIKNHEIDESHVGF